MTHAMLTKILVNLAILLVIALGSGIWLHKIKFQTKGYKYLFVIYTFFWMAPMMLRAYAGTMQNQINIDYTWIVLASYGLIGIFIRIFADWLNFSFKSRKAFLYFAIIVQIATYIPLIVSPNTTTNIIQSIGVGVGASCIGSFQLLFKEQYNQEKDFLTISILSIPPLIANFITAPIQSIFMVAAKVNNLNNIHILKYMWLIGIVFVIISFILMLFLRENRNYFNTFKHKTTIFKPKQDTLPFIVLMCVGLLITFIKFSTSGSVATLHLQTIANISQNDCSAYEGYLSVIFSLLQLIGGVLVGTILIKKINTVYIFAIGSVAWVLYMILAMVSKNPIIYFIVHGINGFAYGILYNLVLGNVLTKRYKNNVITPMGVYQSVLAIGISLSGIFTQFLKNNINKNDYWYANNLINGILIVVTVVLFLMYSLNTWIDHYYKQKQVPSFKI